MVKSERAARIEELFLAAMSLEREARAALLADSTAEDRALRAEVESLLAHHDASSRFLATPVVDLSQDHAEAPARIGPFRILRELGHGGMGVVYLAEQEHPRRTVALKVIRPGVASPNALRRFEHEAEVLARLQHPGIAQIFEAGTADYGAGVQPYFALEFIQGSTLGVYVAERRLGTRERLSLLAQVCDALDHAHHRGVIHRDLKPTNVLVDESSGAPQAKVLDFGIARVTDGDVQTTSLRTDVGQVIGTVPYMSPEQASGDPAAIDHKSDVYALGVIGYELLCGRLPLDVVGKPLHEAVRIVREDEPTPLSRVVPTLRGDVETIFAKALEKDRERRYASAGELAADIRRYLADQPIVARRATRWYVLSKFARRNKVLVGGVAGVFIALVIGMVGTGWQAVLAAGARDRATDAANRAQAQSTRADAEAVEARDQRDRADREAQRATEAANRAQAQSARADAEAVVARDQRDRADREAKRASAVARFQRDMLGRVNPARDGRDVKLAAVLDSASAGVAASFGDDPSVEEAVRATLAESYEGLGLYEESEREYRACVDACAKAYGSEADATWVARKELGELLLKREALAEAETLLRGAFAHFEQLYGFEHAKSLSCAHAVTLLELRLRHTDEAERLARRALEVRKRLNADDSRELRVAVAELGNTLWQLGRLAEAEELLSEGLELERAADPQDKPRLATSCSQLANVVRFRGDPQRAEALYREAIDIGRPALGDAHPDLWTWLNNLAGALQDQHKLTEAETLLREVVDRRIAYLGEDHADTLTAMSNLALALSSLGRFDEAEALHRRTVAIKERVLGADDKSTLISRHNLALVLLLGGNLEDALPVFRECAESAPRAYPAGHWQIAKFRESYGTCLQQLQRFEEAEPELLTALEQMRGSFDDDNPNVQLIQSRLHDMYVAWGKPEKAAEYPSGPGQ